MISTALSNFIIIKMLDLSMCFLTPLFSPQTSKKIKKLEKETNVYKQKWESSNKALLDMISHVSVLLEILIDFIL